MKREYYTPEGDHPDDAIVKVKDFINLNPGGKYGAKAKDLINSGLEKKALDKNFWTFFFSWFLNL